MADLLPSRPDISDDGDKEPRVVGLDSDDVDDLLAAISSETARQALAELHDEPGPPSDIADRIDTSIQNAQYHLDRLETSGLIEPAGTAYSEKGREMTVYAPSDGALVVVAGSEDETSGLQSALTQLLGGIGALALGSLVVDRLVRSGAGPTLSTTSGDGGDVAAGGDGGAVNQSRTTEPDAATSTQTAEPEATPTPSSDGGVGVAEVTETPTAQPTAEPTSTPTEVAADMAETAIETTASAGGAGGGPMEAVTAAISGLPPGAFFFAGGVLALSVLVFARRW